MRKDYRGRLRMKDSTFNPKEEPELLLHPGAYIKYRNGREIVLSDLTMKEIVEAMDIRGNEFHVDYGTEI